MSIKKGDVFENKKNGDKYIALVDDKDMWEPFDRSGADFACKGCVALWSVHYPGFKDHHEAGCKMFESVEIKP